MRSDLSPSFAATCFTTLLALDPEISELFCFVAAVSAGELEGGGCSLPSQDDSATELAVGPSGSLGFFEGTAAVETSLSSWKMVINFS